MAQVANEPPNGWGKDTLTHFQSIAQNNEFASFENLKLGYSLLIELDAYLQSASEFSIMHSHRNVQSLGFLLFINAHNHFRAAVRLLSAGQCLSVYPVGRASIESALYGWLLVVDPEAEEMWHNRPERNDRGASRDWANYFKFSSIVDRVNAVNNGLADRLKYLHQLAIDFGAHPNKDALYSNLKISDTSDGGKLTEIISLHQWDFAFAHSLKFTIETGITILELLEIGEPDSNRLIQLSDKINNLKEGLTRLMRVLEAEIDKEH